MDEIKRKARFDFLSVMYGALWENIDRHITVLWQSAGVLATAFAAALLLKGDSAVADQGAGIDIAVSVVIAMACWLVAHAFDAANWINRNLQIIGNVEAQFLDGTDLKVIHPYIGFARRNKMLMHTKIQASFGIIIAIAAFALHCAARVAGTLHGNAVDWSRAVPAIVLVVGIVCDVAVYRATKHEYQKFLSDMKTGTPGT
jgi:hypothetical protein